MFWVKEPNVPLVPIAIFVFNPIVALKAESKKFLVIPKICRSLSLTKSKILVVSKGKFGYCSFWV
jgi:hypothetical protein